MKIAILVSKYTPKRINIVTCFQKFLHEKYPIARVYLKYLFFVEKMVIFEKKYRQNPIKIHPKTHQIAPF